MRTYNSKEWKIYNKKVITIVNNSNAGFSNA